MRRWRHGDPAGYALADRTQHVVYRSTGGDNVELWWSLATRWRHSNLSAVSGGAPAAGGDPTVYAQPADTQHVIYTAADGRLIELWWTLATGWRSRDLTARAAVRRWRRAAPIRICRPTAHSTWCFGPLTITSTSSAGMAGGGWQHEDLTSASGSAPSAAGDPAGSATADGAR